MSLSSTGTPPPSGHQGVLFQFSDFGVGIVHPSLVRITEDNYHRCGAEVFHDGRVEEARAAAGVHDGVLVLHHLLSIGLLSLL